MVYIPSLYEFKDPLLCFISEVHSVLAEAPYEILLFSSRSLPPGPPGYHAGTSLQVHGALPVRLRAPHAPAPLAVPREALQLKAQVPPAGLRVGHRHQRRVGRGGQQGAGAGLVLEGNVES